MNKINPTGLKGYEITDRMKELMGTPHEAPSLKTSVVELTKLGPDGKVYAIVRENHEYYIKTANNKPDLVVEDFSYIGGLRNKKEFAFHSYEKATKRLNLKFISLNEAYGLSEKFNILEDDGFMKDPVKNNMFQESAKMSECCGAPMKEGVCSECGGAMNEAEEVAEEVVAEIEDNDGEDIPTNGTGEPDGDTLDEIQQAVQDMMEEKKVIQKTLLPKKKLSIATSLTEMDEIIDNLGKKKV